MNRHHCLWASLAVAVLVLSACADRNAENQRQTTRQFEQALAQVQQAQTAPPTSANKNPDLAAINQARCEALAAAGARLKQLMPQLSSDQQVQARRALAVAILPASANLDETRGLQAWATVALDLPLLAHQLDALCQAEASARLLDIDTTPLRGRIEQDATAATGQLKDASEARDAIQKEINALEPQLKDQEAIRDRASARAITLRAQAIQKTGPEQTNLYLQAIKADLQAQKADAQIGHLEEMVADARGRLKIADLEVAKAQDQIDVAKRQLAILDQQVQADQALQQSVLGLTQNPSLASVKKLASEFLDSFASLDSRFEKDVTAPLDRAAQTLASDTGTGSASALLRQASASAEPSSRRVLRLELLHAMVASLGVLNQQQSIVATYARRLDSLSARAREALPQDAGRVQAAAERVAALQKDLATRAHKALTEASTLADELAKGAPTNPARPEGAVAQAATGMKALLETYQAAQPATP